MDASLVNNLVSLTDFPRNASKIVQPAKGYFHEIAFPRESSFNRTLNPQDSKLLPVAEPLTKRVINAYVERGLLNALTVAQQSESAAVASIARRMLAVTNWVRCLLSLSLPESRMLLYAKHSQTRNWSKSVIRAMAWHPQYFKLAVATINDTVYIYTLDSQIKPTLKYDYQKSITCLAWRPNAAGDLAIGCKTCVLIWSYDSASKLSRPVVPPIVLKHGGIKHSPVSSITWSKNGMLLVTASVSDTSIFVWDVDSQQCTALHRISKPCGLVSFSPSGDELLASTISQLFTIQDWRSRSLPSYWTLPKGAIQSFAWSKKHNHLLYVTTEHQELFHMQLESKSFSPICALIDLKRNKTANGLMVGGTAQTITWSPQDSFLAISFKDTSAIAVFVTIVKARNFSIHPYCFIVGAGLSYPCYILFQENYINLGSNTEDTPPSVLTVGWSSGSILYYPMKEYSAISN